MADSCAEKLKVLADSTRLAVIEHLIEGPRPVGDLAEVLDVEQSLLSHHLRTLRDAGLVTCRRQGRRVLYELAGAVRADVVGPAIELGCCRISFEERGRR